MKCPDASDGLQERRKQTGRTQGMDKETFEREALAAERSLYGVAYSILKNQADCADAIQSALLYAYWKLDTLRNEAYFRTWLTRILINECYRILHCRQRETPLEEYLADRGSLTETQPEPTGVFEELMKLERKLRVPLVLYYVAGYSTKEIAKMLGITKENVRIRLYRGRRALQKQLKGDDGI